MQRPDEVHLAETINSAESTQAVRFVHYFLYFKSITENVDKLQRLMETYITDADLIKYLPAMAQLTYQGIIYTTGTKKVPARST